MLAGAILVNGQGALAASESNGVDDTNDQIAVVSDQDSEEPSVIPAPWYKRAIDSVRSKVSPSTAKYGAAAILGMGTGVGVVRYARKQAAKGYGEKAAKEYEKRIANGRGLAEARRRFIRQMNQGDAAAALQAITMAPNDFSHQKLGDLFSEKQQEQDDFFLMTKLSRGHQEMLERDKQLNRELFQRSLDRRERLSEGYLDAKEDYLATERERPLKQKTIKEMWAQQDQLSTEDRKAQLMAQEAQFIRPNDEQRASTAQSRAKAKETREALMAKRKEVVAGLLSALGVTDQDRVNAVLEKLENNILDLSNMAIDSSKLDEIINVMIQSSKLDEIINVMIPNNTGLFAEIGTLNLSNNRLDDAKIAEFLEVFSHKDEINVLKEKIILCTEKINKCVWKIRKLLSSQASLEDEIRELKEKKDKNPFEDQLYSEKIQKNITLVEEINRYNDEINRYNDEIDQYHDEIGRYNDEISQDIDDHEEEAKGPISQEPEEMGDLEEEAEGQDIVYLEEVKSPLSSIMPSLRTLNLSGNDIGHELLNSIKANMRAGAYTFDIIFDNEKISNRLSIDKKEKSIWNGLR